MNNSWLNMSTMSSASLAQQGLTVIMTEQHGELVVLDLWASGWLQGDSFCTFRCFLHNLHALLVL